MGGAVRCLSVGVDWGVGDRKDIGVYRQAYVAVGWIVGVMLNRAHGGIRLLNIITYTTIHNGA